MPNRPSHVALAAALALTAPALAAPASAQKIENSYICVFKTGAVAKQQVRSAANAAAQAHGGVVQFVYTAAIRGFALRISAEGVARLRAANPRIAYCEQDQVMQIPPVRIAARPGGGSTQPSESLPWGVKRVTGTAGGVSGATGRAFVVDTGIDLDHPDLRVNAELSRSFTREKDANDGNGHGTHVAGTIAAIKGNGLGVIGVAAGAELVAVKVLTRSGSGSTSGVIAGVDYVAQVGRSGDVANMSLGGGASPTLDQAVINASALVKFSIAAGNDSANAGNYSPARANGTNIFTISSFTQNNDSWSSFSNFGNPPIDYGQPGSAIPSTYKDGGYATLSGTSMAAPHLAGLLLIGPLRSGGQVNDDPDGNPDTIAIH